MEKWQKIAALLVLLAVAFVLLRGFPSNVLIPSGPVVGSFSFAKFVDENMNYIASDGTFRKSENLYFIMQLSNLTVKNGQVFYRVDAEVTDSSGAKTFSDAIIEDNTRVESSGGRITVAGGINMLRFGSIGSNILKIKVTDKFSNKETVLERNFSVVND